MLVLLDQGLGISLALAASPSVPNHHGDSQDSFYNHSERLPICSPDTCYYFSLGGIIDELIRNQTEMPGHSLRLKFLMFKPDENAVPEFIFFRGDVTAPAHTEARSFIQKFHPHYEIHLGGVLTLTGEFYGPRFWSVTNIDFIPNSSVKMNPSPSEGETCYRSILPFIGDLYPRVLSATTVERHLRNDPEKWRRRTLSELACEEHLIAKPAANF